MRGGILNSGGGGAWLRQRWHWPVILFSSWPVATDFTQFSCLFFYSFSFLCVYQYIYLVCVCVVFQYIYKYFLTFLNLNLKSLSSFHILYQTSPTISLSLSLSLIYTLSLTRCQPWAALSLHQWRPHPPISGGSPKWEHMLNPASLLEQKA